MSSTMEQQQIILLGADVAELQQEEEGNLEEAIYGQYQQELIVGNVEGNIIQICIQENAESEATEYYYIQEESPIDGPYLHHMYDSLQRDLETQNIDINALNHVATVDPNTIEQTIEMELQRTKENCAIAEENYIQQMLAENPIVVESRHNSNNNHHNCEQSEDETIDVVTVSEPAKQNKKYLLQRQRIEACRRSRYNDKIKKAKTAYRHQYMAKRLNDSVHLFNCIQAVIGQAESYLLHREFPLNQLRLLRLQYGVDKAIEEAHLMTHAINQNCE